LLLPYQLRLAVRSLRRDPGLSATIVVVLAVAAGIFAAALMHYLRIYGASGHASPSLHQVEVKVPATSLTRAFSGSTGEPNVLAGRMRVSYPNYQRLAASGIPARQTACFRSRVYVQPDGVGTADFRPRPVNVRFVDADFFGMFGADLRWGAVFSREDEAAGAPVVVIAKDLNRRLFGGTDSVGRTLRVDGRPFRIVGVLAEDQPFAPEWDRVVTGSPQDLLYLPFPEHVRLRARPEAPVQQAPSGTRYAELLASSTVFVSFWVDLPTPESRAAYAAFVRTALDPRDVTVLRDLAQLRVDFRYPRTGITFFVFLTFVVLLGAGLITARLLLAKGVARRHELGIFRALGAPRRSLVIRQLYEAALLSSLAGVLSLAVAMPQAAYYNHLVADTDIPLRVTAPCFLITFSATVVVGLAFALYPAWRAASRSASVALVRS
jgi:putative ABC transport system permease protein